MRGSAERYRFAVVLALAVWMSFAASARASAPADPQARWWLGFGLGYGYLSAAPGPAPAGASGVWVEAQLGYRLAPHWLAGFELGGLGVQISQRNYDPDNSDSSIYGQGITHELLVVQYQPRLDAGFFAGAGVGGLLYDNRALQRVTFNERSGNGFGALARVGYDWRVGRHAHVEVDLSYERGDVRLNAPLSGRFDLNMVAAAVRISHH